MYHPIHHINSGINIIIIHCSIFKKIFLHFNFLYSNILIPYVGIFNFLLQLSWNFNPIFIDNIYFISVVLGINEYK